MSSLLRLRGCSRAVFESCHLAPRQLIQPHQPTRSGFSGTIASGGTSNLSNATRMFQRVSYGSPRYQRRFYYSQPAGTGFSAKTAYWMLLGINAVPFALWQYGQYANDNKLRYKLIDNTLVSLQAISSGRWWTTITSTFTHQDPMHFAFNMFTAFTFCNILARVPGMRGIHIIGIALGSGLAGSIGWLVQQRAKAMNNTGYERQKAVMSSALGASGAVMGLGAVATCFSPRLPMSLMFIPIPIPLWFLTIGYAVFDTYQLQSPTSRTAHAGHLGGLFMGTAIYLIRLRRLAPFGLWHSLKTIVGRR